MDAVIWTVLPIALLSLLPHKEARYLIPVIPFLAVLAAHGCFRFASWCDGGSTRRIGRLPVALWVLVAIVGVLHDMGHWRLPRRNADVRFATQAMQLIPRRSAVAAEQAWRLGGRVYFRDYDLTDLDPQQLSGDHYLWAHVPAGAWIILDHRSMTDLTRAGLAARGYQEARFASDSRYGLWRPSTSASDR